MKNKSRKSSANEGGARPDPARILRGCGRRSPIIQHYEASTGPRVEVNSKVSLG